MMQNISIFEDQKTAHTHTDCAAQRALNVYLLGVKNVLELCVGPSLQDLEKAYNKLQINVTGNDIDSRWQKYYKQGKWIIDDALNINYNSFEGIIFAPPLSKGCSGKREDSLSVDQVNPSYRLFLDKCKEQSYKGLICLVLPARSIATSEDRKQFYKLLNYINKNNVEEIEIVELKAGQRKITKYIDLYFKINND